MEEDSDFKQGAQGRSDVQVTIKQWLGGKELAKQIRA